MIRSIALVSSISILVLLFVAFFCGIRLTIQASNSMPKGLYLVFANHEPAEHITYQRGEVVVFSPPSSILPFLKARHWISKNDWMMKKVMGVPGDLVCLKEHIVWINGNPVGSVLDQDREHRALPQLKFCRKLSQDEYFAMSNYIEHSFDSRYFGVIPSSSIIGKAFPLWIS